MMDAGAHQELVAIVAAVLAFGGDIREAEHAAWVYDDHGVDSANEWFAENYYQIELR
jgi:hypothetical protein